MTSSGLKPKEIVDIAPKVVGVSVIYVLTQSDESYLPVVGFCLSHNLTTNILDLNINGFSPAITSPHCNTGNR